MSPEQAALPFDGLPPAHPPKRRNDAPEAAALIEVLLALRHHPLVGWVERMNSGAIRVGDRFVRFGWRGCSDILGQLRDGRLLACEVKAPGGRLRPEQAQFLSLVRRHGGTAIVARDCNDVLRELGRASVTPRQATDAPGSP